MSNSTLESDRAKYAFIVSLLGLGGTIVIVLGLIAVNFGNGDSTKIVAIAGTITGLVGTIVGAFLGVQAGSADKPALYQHLQETQATLNRAIAALSKDEAEKVLTGSEIKG